MTNSAKGPGLVRHRVVYRGRVQGIGFRYTTERIAQRFDVAGYVKNLRDGTVELVAVGTGDELAGFQNAISEHFRGHITDAEVENLPEGELFDGFGIRY